MTKQASELLLTAMSIFGHTARSAGKKYTEQSDEAKVSGTLYALGLRETCSRCHGSGRYSFNSTTGDTCFGCNGRGERAAKLTATVLSAARAKVEAGELTALRAANAAKAAAKREAIAKVAPLSERAKAAYVTLYARGEGGRGLASDLRDEVTDLTVEIKHGAPKDPIALVARLEAVTAQLESLV